MPAPTSGTYRIHSAYRTDGRYVQNNSGLLQLELLDHGTSNDQKFQVTLTGNGTYTIQSLTGGGGSGIEYRMDGSGRFILYSVGNADFARWTIQQANGSSDPNQMNIVTAQGAFPGSTPLARLMLWNRLDTGGGDDNGRLQLMNAGSADPHNNWFFEAV